MSVAGTYECVTKTPMGDQKSDLTINVDGDTFTGTNAGAQGTLSYDRLVLAAGSRVIRPALEGIIERVKSQAQHCQGGAGQGGVLGLHPKGYYPAWTRQGRRSCKCAS